VRRDGAEVTSTGRSFHVWAPATRKTRCSVSEYVRSTSCLILGYGLQVQRSNEPTNGWTKSILPNVIRNATIGYLSVCLPSVTKVGIKGLFSYINIGRNALLSRLQLGFLLCFQYLCQAQKKTEVVRQKLEVTWTIHLSTWRHSMPTFTTRRYSQLERLPYMSIIEI